MAHHTTNALSRRLAAGVRSVNVSAIAPSRLYTASAQCYADRTPTLADIVPGSAQSFDVKQKEFREHLKASKEKADRQYSASQRQHLTRLSESNDAVFSTSMALGSLSPFAGEHREAARAREESEESPKKKGMLGNLIYGTEAGREMDREVERSFSQVLARGKYVHSIVFHEVMPDKVDEYIQLVGGWYPKVAHEDENHVNLVGSWRTEVGDCDTFVHIWEYQRYDGYHRSLHTIQSRPEFIEFDKKLKTLITSKKSSLMQEFSFWPTTPPRKLGGLFELRSYTLHPGNLLEWETHWRRGLKARREVMEGVGAWFVQVGDLNTVHHLWQFADLEQRKIRREQSWSVEGWGDTVHKTVPLIQTMKSNILIPMEWSPVG